MKHQVDTLTMLAVVAFGYGQDGPVSFVPFLILTSHLT